MISWIHVIGSPKKHNNCGLNCQLWYWSPLSRISLLLPSYICVWMFCFCFYTVSKVLSTCISFNLACHVIDTKYWRINEKLHHMHIMVSILKIKKLKYRWKQIYCLGMKISAFVIHFWNYVLFGKSLFFWVSVSHV